MVKCTVFFDWKPFFGYAGTSLMKKYATIKAFHEDQKRSAKR